MMERIVPVIGAAGGDAFLTAWLDIWAQPIRLDPKWNGGDYYGKEPPTEGLKAALKIVSLHANAPDWASKTFALVPAAEGKDPGKALDNKFKIEAALDQGSAARAAGSDANHLLYLVKANQLAAADPSKIKVPALIVYAPTDLVFPPEWVERTIAAIKANGTPVKSATLSGPNGHLNGVLHIAQAGPAIAEFLAGE
jgi:homoserine O-acetyltransferase/O-succinyltransferase